MELNNITLEHWLEDKNPNKYYNKKVIDYSSKYKSIKDYLIEVVYNDVTSSANYLDEGAYYNNHGKEHVETVIERATQIAKSNDCDFSAKEVYFLLCAILIHDIGMIFGRKKHETNSKIIIEKIKTLFSTDQAEQTVIFNIAKAHGGKTDEGSKNTIEPLVDRYYTNELVRTQLIASILRFSDELADDSKRASKTVLDKGLLYHKPSEVFHAYSLCLKNVLVCHEDHSVKLNFEIPADYLNRTFGKYEEKVFIIDEIYVRLLKLYLENEYCQKYMSKYIKIDKIQIDIDFISPADNPFDYTNNLPTKFTFTMTNNGYPETPINRIFEICPTVLLDDNKKAKDGIYFLNQFYTLNKQIL